MDDSLHRRGQALEDLFFQQQDKLLMERMRSEIAKSQAIESLSHVSGIQNREVLSSLVKLGIAPGTMVCLTMVPLVCVAWADGHLDDRERSAILKAADENGIRTGSASYELLQSWLANRPGPELFDGWKLYTTSLKCSLDAVALNQVRNTIMDRSKKVAEAAGGFLGIGAISQSEQKVFAAMEKVFA